MDFKSLGLKTDLIVQRLSEVTDRGAYAVVRTRARPDFMWGNFVIMREPPARAGHGGWTAVFEREIGPREKTGYMAFAWDEPDGAEQDLSPFVDAGFSLTTSNILTASTVTKPARYNPTLTVRPLTSDADWNGFLEVHFSDDWSYGGIGSQEAFLRNQRDDLRALVDAGHGLRFGAFADERLVAELGIYWDGVLARFNNIGTARAFRRQGACSTLVFDAARYVLAHTPCRMLVIEAVEGGAAAGLYEAVGFRPAQRVHKLEWLA